MATIKGQLGAKDVPGNGTLTSIYKVPAGQEASINLNIANRADTVTNYKIAHIKNGNVGDVANEDYLMFDLPSSELASNLSPIQLTGITMGANDTIAVSSSASAVSAQANGIEKVAS